ncbi:MAG: hypothetical protein AAF596_09165, partial [Planctomycetota bacterium]
MASSPRFLAAATLAVALAAAVGGPISAAPPADTIFPDQTVAFLSVPDPNELSDRFRKTQVGQLVQDESMEEFAKHLRDQAVNQVGDIENRLAVTTDDLFDAAGGELAIGFVFRGGDAATLVMTLDVTGKQAEADKLLAKVDQSFVDRGAKKSAVNEGGVAMTRYDVPPPKPLLGLPPAEPRSVVYFQSGDLLVAVDRAEEAPRFATAAASGAAKPLAAVTAYQKILERCRAEVAGERSDMRWFLDPFRFKDARATMQMPEFLASRKDMMTILGENGFRAIEAIGGFVGLALDGDRDLQHCTVFYAPGNQAAGTEPSKRFDGAMRIADTPNRADLGIEPWAPRSTASYNTASLNIQGVFDNLAPLFDEVAGYEDAFETTLEGFEKDPFGPKINVRDEIIEHLGGRITVMTDYTLPVKPDCERYLFVVEVKGESQLRGPLDRLMENDGAQRRELKGVSYWEVIPEEDDADDLGGLPDFDDPLFDDPLFDDDGGQGEGGDAAADTRHSAVCLHDGQLVIASDVEFLEQALFGVGPNESL